jgi:cytochrome c oxidase subunit 3
MAMAMTVTGSGGAVGRLDTTLDVKDFRSRGNGRGGRGGNGGGPNGKRPGHSGGHDGAPRRYRIGVLVGIASILMMFSALASAYIVRSGIAGPQPWQRPLVPSFIWVSTAVILISSVTIALALRAQKRQHLAGVRLWLGATLILGLSFLLSQLLAWRQLVAAGVYLASNPHSSFFYVLTGLHGVHLLGGIGGLSYVIYLAWCKTAVGPRGELKLRTLTDVVAIYWHFMDGLWVFLFLLLFLWR